MQPRFNPAGFDRQRSIYYSLCGVSCVVVYKAGIMEPDPYPMLTRELTEHLRIESVAAYDVNETTPHAFKEQYSVARVYTDHWEGSED